MNFKDTPEIGPVIQRERKARRLTLEQLAALSGVSKSMLSQIERRQANPTFAVLWSLTQALRIDFSDLVAASTVPHHRDPIEVTPRGHTPEITSQDGLCRLRILSPPGMAGRSEWYDIEIAPGGRLQSAPHARGAGEHLTVLAGRLEIASAGASRSVAEGETARYRADVEHEISNTSRSAARALLVLLYE
ncbi:helix-turn-helix domain-containing protein [Devosia sediminis]|uniref:Helix-turn-helix transcriptional regulator n=1 Tax=Devosia sediminis TaxID=2798801 RepID=A0A934MJJ4_9HYPH|nr:XRE family transcriptional regulator [Devosia sediminis]MBJ3783135.1 helix-turn-helix transcriptional regulator [Devosia sediminis]